MMPRVVMAPRIAAPRPFVHGIVPRASPDLSGRRRPARHLSVMSRGTVNLICAELPGTEKVPDPEGRDLWTAAGEAFARVGETIEVRSGDGWTALPPGTGDHAARERIVEAYERLRHLLPPEAQSRLDRTSG